MSSDAESEAYLVRIPVEPHDLPARFTAVLPVERLDGTAGRAVPGRLRARRPFLLASDVREASEHRGRPATIPVRLLLHGSAGPVSDLPRFSHDYSPRRYRSVRPTTMGDLPPPIRYNVITRIIFRNFFCLFFFFFIRTFFFGFTPP